MKRIEYKDLNSRQKENYNAAKLGAVMADYGYTCVKLSDDYNGADLLALHVDGEVLKVQLKARLTIEDKYIGKGLMIAFPDGAQWYLFPHDEAREYFLSNGRPQGSFSVNYLPEVHKAFMSQYAVGGPR